MPRPPIVEVGVPVIMLPPGSTRTRILLFAPPAMPRTPWASSPRAVRRPATLTSMSQGAAVPSRTTAKMAWPPRPEVSIELRASTTTRPRPVSASMPSGPATVGRAAIAGVVRATIGAVVTTVTSPPVSALPSCVAVWTHTAALSL